MCILRFGFTKVRNPARWEFLFGIFDSRFNIIESPHALMGLGTALRNARTHPTHSPPQAEEAENLLSAEVKEE